jgi:hypothetical protein
VSVVYSEAQRVFILKRHFASKPFPAIHEPFSIAYLDKKVPNHLTGYQLVTTFQDTRSVYDRQHVQH